jgi:hypothetical protein
VDSNGAHSGDYLYTRGKPTSTCTVILNGNVTVLAGADSFKVEATAWSALGGAALAPHDDSATDSVEFVPDFSAYISSDSLRCIRITRASVFALMAAHVAGAANEAGTSAGASAGAGSGSGGVPAPPAAVASSWSTHVLHHKHVRKGAEAGAAVKRMLSRPDSNGGAEVAAETEETNKKVSNLVPRKHVTEEEHKLLKRKPSMRVLKYQVRFGTDDE